MVRSVGSLVSAVSRTYHLDEADKSLDSDRTHSRGGRALCSRLLALSPPGSRRVALPASIPSLRCELANVRGA